MNKEINLDKLVEAYKDEDYDRYEIRVKHDISFVEMVALARMVIENTQFDKNGNYRPNTCKLKYMSRVVWIDLYTNIIIDKEHALEEYDKLISIENRNIYDDISFYTAQFESIVHDTAEDIKTQIAMDNKDLLTSINSSLSFILGGVGKFLENVNGMIENADDEQIKAVMSKFTEK